MPAAAEEVRAHVEGSALRVASVEARERRQNPAPPFPTPKLQQAAARSIGFSVRKTMTLAEAFIECGAPPHKATKYASKRGRAFKDLYRRDHDGQEPMTHKQLVNNRECLVADYEVSWVQTMFAQVKQWIEEFMA